MLNRIWFPVFILMVCFILPLANGTLGKLSFDAMLFPWLIGGTAIILLFFEIVKEAREARGQDALSDKESGDAWKKRKYFFAGIAWVFAILPMIYLIGILPAIPIYLFAFFKLHGEKLWLSLILPVVITSLFYGIFVIALDITFYQGVLWQYVNG